MPLKLGHISQQVEEMASRELDVERQHHLEEARALLHRLDAGPTTSTPWLAATPLGSLDGAFPAPPTPVGFTVAAADGSSMGPDRHFPVRYYVLNTGHAVLTYGSHPAARLDSTSRLYFRDDEVFVSLQHRTLPRCNIGRCRWREPSWRPRWPWRN